MDLTKDEKRKQPEIEGRFILQLTPDVYYGEATTDAIADCVERLYRGEGDTLLLSDRIRVGLTDISVVWAMDEYGVLLTFLEEGGGNSYYRKYIEKRDDVLELLWDYSEELILPDLTTWVDVTDER